ncbi:hypothetical protein Igag_0405 [Ignisphaera aggregans DSM 17230]|uniref:Uncharacterized protein n=1 Tax=Ignisphaera aggregans (strain DSM 17230 / JCM 13409 / AQ1.S1) TaxID=583356 RepID=E0SR95_IGNAA|nr:hypothetical protein Igag_0405 [Ignisphaera aggregans DSM 17230]
MFLKIRRRDILNELDNSYNHYLKVMNNCIGYLTILSKFHDIYRCSRCNKYFLSISKENSICPFCGSRDIRIVDDYVYRSYVENFCSNLYGRILILIEFMKILAIEFCREFKCRYSFTRPSLDISIDRNTNLRIELGSDRAIDIALSYLDILMLQMIDRISSTATTLRKDFSKYNIKYLVFRINYENIDIDFITLIREKFIDAYHLASILRELGLESYSYLRGVAIKIFDIERNIYIDPLKLV